MTTTMYLPVEITSPDSWPGRRLDSPCLQLISPLPQATRANAAQHNLGALTPKDLRQETGDATSRSQLFWCPLKHYQIQVMMPKYPLPSLTPCMLRKRKDYNDFTVFSRDCSLDYCDRRMLAVGFVCSQERSEVLCDSFPNSFQEAAYT